MATPKAKEQKREVVINGCFGGFSLSRDAFLLLRKMKNKYAMREPDIGEMWKDGSGPRESLYDSFCRDIPRDDKDLVTVVRKLKEKANGTCANLRIVEIPMDVQWEIEEYDGNEHVAEAHSTWC